MFVIWLINRVIIKAIENLVTNGNSYNIDRQIYDTLPTKQFSTNVGVCCVTNLVLPMVLSVCGTVNMKTYKI